MAQFNRRLVLLVGCFCYVSTSASLGQDFAASCSALSKGVTGAGRIVESQFVGAGQTPLAAPAPPGSMTPTPDHCLVRGKINERTGIDGKPYAIGYELRLPVQWNGKFFFQGGGGVDGILRPALGVISSGGVPPNGLSKGYAVASTDSGHLAESGPVGDYLFGLDPQARADKGYNSIPTTAVAAKAVMEALYSKAPSRSYFIGCSNGGRQAMMATQRYSEMFDGVIAAAPAYRVPLAAIDGIGHTKEFLAIAPKAEDGTSDMGNALTKDDLKTVADGVLQACDALDGVKDGMVQNVAACKFDPASVVCVPGQNSACLSEAKAKALSRIYAGTRNSRGEVIYSRWPWDPGLASPGWTIWRIGTPGAKPPNAFNVKLIPGSIAYDFMSPPETPNDLLAWSLAFDFDRDTARVMKGSGGFESGMEFEAAVSTDLDRFRARGGKIIFTHGTADPIFSPLDTIAYLDRLKERYGTATPDFARLFLVPGMNHCAGGPSTDAFDAVSALDTWVETETAPDAIIATARNVPGVPWPGRTRPLCPWPKFATYKGTGSIEDAANFECR
jgi:pimeloyl-ACP methyl ester carboxylesterase